MFTRTEEVYARPVCKYFPGMIHRSSRSTAVYAVAFPVQTALTRRGGSGESTVLFPPGSLPSCLFLRRPNIFFIYLFCLPLSSSSFALFSHRPHFLRLHLPNTVFFSRSYLFSFFFFFNQISTPSRFSRLFRLFSHSLFPSFNSPLLLFRSGLPPPPLFSPATQAPLTTFKRSA